MSSTGGRHRRFRITIRVSRAERSAIDAAAKRSGVTLSAYARQILLGAKPLRAARRPPVETSLLVRILDQLGRIAATLSRFGMGSVDLLPSTEREVTRCLTELRGLRPHLLRALGKRATGS